MMIRLNNSAYVQYFSTATFEQPNRWLLTAMSGGLVAIQLL
jgi:hypothetical protein